MQPSPSESLPAMDSPTLPHPNGNQNVHAKPIANDNHATSQPAEEREPSLSSAASEVHDDGPSLAPSPPQAAFSPPLAILADTSSMEERIRRLENALNQLTEQRPPTSGIVTQPPQETPPSPATPSFPSAILDAGRRILTGPPPSEATTPSRPALVWLLWDTWAEARVIVRMFLDPRYHLPWSARVVPIILLAAILTSKFWVPGSSIPIVGEWLLVKFVDLVLAFVLFKWLGHESRRYRQTSPDLPPTLRL